MPSRPPEVAESILNAAAIYKTIRSTSPNRSHRREYLHIIWSTTLDGCPIGCGRFLGPYCGAGFPACSCAGWKACTTIPGHTRPIYTKGKLVAEGGVETYYFLVSAKRAE
jgi:hypothetical protein